MRLITTATCVATPLQERSYRCSWDWDYKPARCSSHFCAARSALGYVEPKMVIAFQHRWINFDVSSIGETRNSWCWVQRPFLLFLDMTPYYTSAPNFFYMKDSSDMKIVIQKDMDKDSFQWFYGELFKRIFSSLLRMTLEAIYFSTFRFLQVNIPFTNEGRSIDIYIYIYIYWIFP